ncbi:hypothetical protein KUCAC02_014249, partial [Chaenocephalus aceratus]
MELETTPVTVDSPLSRAQTRIRVSSQEKDGLFLVLIPEKKKAKPGQDSTVLSVMA